MASKIADAFVEVSARTDKLNRALGGVRQRLKKFGAGLAMIGKRAAIGFGVALATGIALSVKAAAEQEVAEKKLESALRSSGDAVDTLLPKFKAFAASIQKQTTVGDENVLSMLATIRNLGVMPDQMEKATKGAIGLSRALNLDAESAARYTALALQGEVTILQRYVPALRAATTQAEKQAIVTALMNRGFEQAQAETQTVAGRFTQLKNNIGDAFEQVGFMITESIGLKEIFVKLSKGTLDLTEKFKRMRDGNFFLDMSLQAKLFADEVETRFKIVGTRIKALAKTLTIAAIPVVGPAAAPFAGIKFFKEAADKEVDILQQSLGTQALIQRKHNELIARLEEERKEKLAEREGAEDKLTNKVTASEEKKQKARAKTAGQFLGFTAAIKKAQEAVGRAAERARQKIAKQAAQRAAVPVGAVPVARAAAPVDAAPVARAAATKAAAADTKAAMKRDKIISILQGIELNTKESAVFG